MKISRIVSVLLSALLLLSAVTVASFAAGTPEGTAVSTAEEFAAMEANGNYYLAADITVDKSYAKAFSGTFDGNGHTVTVSAPMFNIFNGTIKNLTIEGKIDVKQENVGAIAGTSNFGFSADNVVNNADVSGITLVGGFVGSSYSAEITNCVNNGNISAQSASAAVGGFLGHPANGAGNFDVIIRVCLNTGTITSIYDSGGFIGNMGLSGNSPTNAGEYLIEKSANTGAVNGGRYAGGFVGYTYASGSTAYLAMRYCTNSGKLTGGRASSSGFISEFIAYTNSASTTINFCVGMGEIALTKGAASSNTYVCIMGCSSADTMKCNIYGVILCDNEATTYYSYATSASNSANRHVISSMFGNDKISRVKADKIADGSVTKTLNYLSASSAMVDCDGIPMAKALAAFIKDSTPGAVVTEAPTQPAAPEPTEAPTEPVTDPVTEPVEEKKGCGSAALSAALIAAAVLGSAWVSKKRA